MTLEEHSKEGRRLAVIGCLMSCIALVGAVHSIITELSPWFVLMFGFSSGATLVGAGLTYMKVLLFERRAA